MATPTHGLVAPGESEFLEIFPNGTKLLIVNDQQRASAALSISLPGSRFHTNPLIPHYTEHGMADVSRRHPSPQQFLRAIDSQTRGFEAEVRQETTTFTAVMSNTMDSFLSGEEFLRAVILHPRFPKKFLSKERTVLGVERQESDDNAEEVLDEALDSSVFRGHPLGARVHGSREALASIPAEEIRAWHQQMIKSPLSITVVGSLDVKYVRQHLRRYYGRIASAGKVRSPRFHLTQHQLRTTFVPWPSGLVYIGLTTVFPFGLRDPRRLALSALNNHLGDESRWSNRLVLSLRGDNRLVYTVGSSIYSYREASILTTTTSCDPENVPRVLQAITQEYHRLKTTLLDPKEIALVTKSMLANSEDRSESSLKYANFLSRQLYTTGQVVTHRSLRERLPIATTSAAIRSVARLLLRDRTSLVLVGPMKHINRRQVVRALEF